MKRSPLRRTAPEARLYVPVVKTCKCGKEFTPRSSTHRVCSPKCAIKVVKEKNKERREAAKPRSKWLQEAQSAFNAWVRQRDAALPCVSCGRFHDGQWHAGHYLSTGARPELRYTETNVWRQCQPCNTHLSGNLVLYRAELIRRVGLEEVERLEGPHPPQKWTVDQLKEIKAHYSAKIKALLGKE